MWPKQKQDYSNMYKLEERLASISFKYLLQAT